MTSGEEAAATAVEAAVKYAAKKLIKAIDANPPGTGESLRAVEAIKHARKALKKNADVEECMSELGAKLKAMYTIGTRLEWPAKVNSGLKKFAKAAKASSQAAIPAAPPTAQAQAAHAQQNPENRDQQQPARAETQIRARPKGRSAPSNQSALAEATPTALASSGTQGDVSVALAETGQVDRKSGERQQGLSRTKLDAATQPAATKEGKPVLARAKPNKPSRLIEKPATPISKRTPEPRPPANGSAPSTAQTETRTRASAPASDDKSPPPARPAAKAKAKTEKVNKEQESLHPAADPRKRKPSALSASGEPPPEPKKRTLLAQTVTSEPARVVAHETTIALEFSERLSATQEELIAIQTELMEAHKCANADFDFRVQALLGKSFSETRSSLYHLLKTLTGPSSETCASLSTAQMEVPVFVCPQFLVPLLEAMDKSSETISKGGGGAREKAALEAVAVDFLRKVGAHNQHLQRIFERCADPSKKTEYSLLRGVLRSSESASRGTPLPSDSALWVKRISVFLGRPGLVAAVRAAAEQSERFARLEQAVVAAKEAVASAKIDSVRAVRAMQLTQLTSNVERVAYRSE